MTVFEHKENGLVEQVSWKNILWCLLFGAFYFLYKGIYKHAILGFVAGILTVGISWVVYAFLVPSILKRHYLENGYKIVNLDDNEKEVAPTIGP